jgi:hypothetical protein
MERDNTRYINVELLEWKWLYIKDYCSLDSEDFTVKYVSIKDDKFKDDPKHIELRKASYKASKELRDYEFNKRFNGAEQHIGKDTTNQ